MTPQAEFVSQVKDLRALQKRYFRERKRSLLDECKALERKVEGAAAKLPRSDFVGSVVDMLESQRRYFRGGQVSSELDRARALERQVDAAVRKLATTTTQPGLFDDEESP
jgi:hypothetical protein